VFNLPALLALAADTPSASAIDLSPMTVLLIEAAAGALHDLDNWEGAGDELTRSEIEQINDLVSTLESEVLPIEGTLIYPTTVVLWPDANIVLSGGALSRDNVDGSTPFYADTFQTSNANGNSCKQEFVIKAGTYNFFRVGTRGTTRAKVDWYLDGTLIISGEDWYNATTAAAVLSTSGIVISTDGTHELKFVVNGHNASSSAYVVSISKMWFQP